jgi:hypothetical protein
MVVKAAIKFIPEDYGHLSPGHRSPDWFNGGVDFFGAIKLGHVKFKKIKGVGIEFPRNHPGHLLYGEGLA